MARETGISDATVRRRTGRDWAEWVEMLSGVGAREWSHKEIVAWLAANTDLSGWWQQSVAVGFEKATGKRVRGETASAGFQVGVRVTVAAQPQAVWKAMVSTAGQELWLGTVADLEPNVAGRATDDTEFEIRVVRPSDRIRFARKPADASRASTVQIALVAIGSSKTAIIFHHEKLRDPDEREAMRAHWKAVAAEIKARVEHESPGALRAQGG